jgi:uncharacterized protein
MTSSSLAYHSRTGTIERLGHGVYRLADFPQSPREPLIAAAAALGKDAVVSYESALQLYGVCDVAPSRLHFTVPRARRYVTARGADVELHTTTRPFTPGEVIQHEAFPATSLARSIADAAKTHTAPEQIIVAVQEGLRRGLLTRRDLERAMQKAPARVRALVASAGERAAPRSGLLDRALAVLRRRSNELRARGFLHVAVFGSVARREDGPESDIDLMVEIAPGVDSMEAMRVETVLAADLGREVQIVSRRGLDEVRNAEIFRDMISAF